jgi:serine/threonine-protein kinase
MYSVISLLVVGIGVGLVVWLQSGERDRQPRGLSASATPQISTNPNQPDVSRGNENKQDNENRNSSTPSVEGGDEDHHSPENIPTAQHLVGAWRGKVTELGETFDVTFTAYADGTYQYAAKNKRGQTAKQYGNWQYTDGMLFQTFANGATGKASVEWIDSDTFEITIVDNGVPAYNGLKRRYHRIK